MSEAAPGRRVAAAETARRRATESAQGGPPGGPARPRVGLIVNPLAGIGGAVGLKGSDGASTVRRAFELGAVPHAEERAAAALRSLLDRWPGDRARPELLVAPGSMGEASARLVGLEAQVIGRLAGGTTTAEDTRRIAAAIAEGRPDLLLVAGGDGTARDVCAAVSTQVAVLGIPAGVKIHSPIFATSPLAAGVIAATFLAAAPGRRRTALAEVVDLDEDAYRRGEIAPRLFGELRVPAEGRRVQARKEPSPASESSAASGVAEGVARRLAGGGRSILGPGSTVRAVAVRLGVPKTLVGVDVVDIASTAAIPVAAPSEGSVATVVAMDVGARELERLVGALGLARRLTLVVTPIGGQGFILGRGNQQLSAAAIRTVLASGGREALIVAATPGKLASLRGRPFLVDTGDAALDAELAGHITVYTGPEERTIYRVAVA